MDISSVVSSAKKVLGDAKSAAGATLASITDAATSTLAGSTPTIFDRLEADHATFRDLMKKLAATTARGAKVRADLFGRLRAAVIAHARAEEAVLYEALKRTKKTRPEVLEGVEEHHLTDIGFAEMAKLAPTDERWTAKLAVLSEGLRHHIDEEERELFRDARKTLSPRQMVELGDRFAAEKARQLANLSARPKRAA